MIQGSGESGLDENKIGMFLPDDHGYLIANEGQAGQIMSICGLFEFMVPQNPLDENLRKIEFSCEPAPDEAVVEPQKAFFLPPVRFPIPEIGDHDLGFEKGRGGDDQNQFSDIMKQTDRLRDIGLVRKKIQSSSNSHRGDSVAP